MGLALRIAVTHLLARKRQTLVSLSGVVLGIAFFLAVSSLMRGSEKDFIKRLVDNSPHITVSDEYRGAEPAAGASCAGRTPPCDIRNVKPQTETRGIRGYPAEARSSSSRCPACAPRRCWSARRC